MKNKLDEVANSVIYNNCDINVFTESWLCDDIADNFIQIPKYNIIRKDRHNNGGGIIIYIKQSIDFTLISFDNIQNYEIISLFVQSFKLLIIAVYHPYWNDTSAHENTLAIFDNIIMNVQDKYANVNIAILGDFNGLTTSMADFCALYKAKNIVDFPTRGNNTIDCIYLQNYKSYNCEQLSPIGASDHCIVKCLPTIKKARTVTYKYIPDYSPENRTVLKDTMLSTDFCCHYHINSADELDLFCDLFIQKLYSIISYSFPLKRVKSRLTNLPWISDSIRLVMSKRDDAYKSKNRNLYVHYRNKVKSLIKISRCNYVKDINKLEQKQSWDRFKTAANVTKHKSSYITNIQPSEFLDYFTTSHQTNDTCFNSFISSNQFTQIEVTNTDIELAISKLNKGGGIPFLPQWIFKQFRNQLIVPLIKITEASLSLGHVPRSLKLASITPVPKVKRPVNPKDFRPIATTSPILKILETVVMQKWLAPLINEHLFSDQFAFIPLKGRGCTSALTCILAHCLRGLEDGKFVNMLLVDFSQAFDRVTPAKITDSLISCGATPQVVFWIYNFMTQRQVCVKQQQSISAFKTVNCGVPQGSKISPVLFAFLCSSLRSVTSSCTFFKYADDLTILHTGHHLSDNIQLNEEITNLENWCKDHDMVINSTKTKLMHITRKKHKLSPTLLINNVKIELIHNCRLLGIHIQDDLKWNCHICNTSKKISKLFYPLVCLKRSNCHPSLLLKFYTVFIRPIITYAYPAFSNLSQQQKNQLNKMEKRICKFIGQKPTLQLNEYCDSLCCNLKSAIQKYDNHPFRRYLVANNNLRTRSGNTLTTTPGHTTQYVNSFIKYFLR